MVRGVASVLLVLFPCACGRVASTSAGDSPTASAAPAPPPRGTLALGERITAPAVALTDVAAHPAQYGHAAFTTSGKVTAVCQEMGCWMELEDASGRAHVRMHGHNFFVPKTASGHVARVQATLVGGKEEECDDEPAGSAGKGVAKLQLDATGVELD